MWANGAIFVNPLAATVLVDTDILSANEYDVTVAVQNSVATTATLEQRNVGNTVTLKSYKLRLTGVYVQDFKGINLASGERLRITLDANLTGSIECEIFTAIRPTVPSVQKA